jgi:cytochrome c556
MNKTRFALLAALVALSYQQTTCADDEDVISYRQLLMKQIDAETTALGMMASNQIPADALGLEARSIANAAKAATKAFEPNVPGGEAKPEVWSKWDDFSKRMQVFAQNTDEMAKVAETGNLNRVTELMVTALPCKECHDVYRNKKK